MHLGDSGLVIQVERDFTIYGEELKFGGGKVSRFVDHLVRVQL